MIVLAAPSLNSIPAGMGIVTSQTPEPEPYALAFVALNTGLGSAVEPKTSGLAAGSVIPFTVTVISLM